MATQQSFKNHTRFDPLFHFSLAPLLLLNFVFSIWHWTRVRTHWSAWEILVAALLVLMSERFRSYSLKDQDRIIRLEERLRLTGLGGEAMRAVLPELTVKQLVALRFASDAEVVPLAQRAVREKLTPKQIKEAIQVWRPDEHRV